MNIGEIFAEVELDLVTNLSKSVKGQLDVRRLTAFKEFQKRNQAILSKYSISKEIQDSLQSAYLSAGRATQSDIQAAIEKGYKAEKTATSFSVNDKKLQKLIAEVEGEMRTAQTAALRMMDDTYRKTILKAQTSFATNLYTLDECVDMATKDFLSAGINCIKYKNGAQVNIASYADMALRTGNRRATLQGEGAMRKDWGESLVYISQYGACSDTCLPWQGRIYVDDVYSGGKPQDDYPLLSTAIAEGLFHPNCRHKSTTWYEGLSKIPPLMDEDKIRKASALESEQRYNERQIRKWKRMEAGSLDPANKAEYQKKVEQWQKRQRELIKANPEILRRDYTREKIRGVYGENKFAVEKPNKPAKSAVKQKDIKFNGTSEEYIKEYWGEPIKDAKVEELVKDTHNWIFGDAYTIREEMVAGKLSKSSLSMIDNLEDLAHKMPQWGDKPMYRGMRLNKADFEAFSALKKGDKLSNNLPSSWGKDKDTAVSYSNIKGHSAYYGKDYPIVLVADKGSGEAAAIQLKNLLHKPFKKHDEILLSKNSHLEIERVLHKLDGSLEVYVKILDKG